MKYTGERERRPREGGRKGEIGERIWKGGKNSEKGVIVR